MFEKTLSFEDSLEVGKGRIKGLRQVNLGPNSGKVYTLQFTLYTIVRFVKEASTCLYFDYDLRSNLGG